MNEFGPQHFLTGKKRSFFLVEKTSFDNHNHGKQRTQSEDLRFSKKFKGKASEVGKNQRTTTFRAKK